jgi:ankyrin repeat protein
MLSPAEVSPPYFSTGFPYGKDEFLSYAGTCWAVMALLTDLPEAQSQQEPANPAPAKDEPVSWISTALFGPTSELSARLDAGLDPNIKTASGVTILMFAAHDASKVRLLLSRGADAKARTSSGVDALTIAAAYRGTRESLQLLLDAGVPAQAPEDVHSRHSPLVLASMSGDLENVRMLLSRGAAPDAEALSEAVTFGYADIVKHLIDAGAGRVDPREFGYQSRAHGPRSPTEPLLCLSWPPRTSTSIQWTSSEFTPLMYAATVDVGNTDTLIALLKAGAERSIRNKDHRTALDQARKYKHAKLAEALQ